MDAHLVRVRIRDRDRDRVRVRDRDRVRDRKISKKGKIREISKLGGNQDN